MTKTVLDARNVTDAKEMMEALTDLLEMANDRGSTADMVYPNRLRLTLVEERLTDGSKVHNLCFFDGGEA